MYLYILIAIVFYFLYTSNSQQVNKEKFTDNENLLGEKILELMKRPTHLFGDYLSVLTTYNNTSDNLISKAIYNKFKNNQNLTITDIMAEF
jgi:hypothetical protein